MAPGQRKWGEEPEWRNWYNEESEERNKNFVRGKKQIYEVKQPQKGGRERKRAVRGQYSMTGVGHQRVKGEGKKWQGVLWNNLWNLWQKGIYRPAKRWRSCCYYLFCSLRYFRFVWCLPPTQHVRWCHRQRFLFFCLLKMSQNIEDTPDYFFYLQLQFISSPFEVYTELLLWLGYLTSFP